eukprot:scaffold3568_cov16-Tisochrysis_lutea.AAC.1
MSTEALKHSATLCQIGGGSLQHGQASEGPSFRAHTSPNGSPHQHAPSVAPRKRHRSMIRRPKEQLKSRMLSIWR